MKYFVKKEHQFTTEHRGFFYYATCSTCGFWMQKTGVEELQQVIDVEGASCPRKTTDLNPDGRVAAEGRYLSLLQEALGAVI